MKHVECTHALLHTVCDPATRLAVWVSGGKDSLTLLHLLRPWRAKVTVVHLHEPDGFPDVTPNLMLCMNAWGFLRSVQILPRTSFTSYVEEFGWPVDVVPTALDGATTRPMSPYYTGGIKLASWWHCSLYRHLQPIMWATAAIAPTVVLSGTRGSDAPFFAQTPEWTGQYAGWQRVDPIHHWTTRQVYDYIAIHEISLPEYYSVKRHTDEWEWHDCLSCTWQPEHWTMLKQHYPREYEKRWPAAQAVFTTLREQMSDLTVRLEKLNG